MESITDELREWAHGNVQYKSKHERLTAIADRIDAEHERATAGCIHYDPERHYCTVHGDTESGWVRLPVDAEGVPIRIGDVLDPPADCDDYAPMQVMRLMYDGYEQEWFFDGQLGGFCGLVGEHMDVAGWTHHHAPTVEDVLLDACKAYHGLMTESMSDVAHDLPAPSEVIAEYAAKLRMAEDNSGLYEWERDE